MATSAATIDHLPDALSGAGTLTARKMFGEYALYLNGTVVAFVCDDTPFIKPTPGAAALLPDAEKGPACPGSKDDLTGSDLPDDPDLCSRGLKAVASDAPPPKAKAPKTAKAG